MPYTDPAEAKRIIDSAGDYDAAYAVSPEGIEPLFAYYSADLLPLLSRSISEKEYSLYRIISKINALGITISRRVVTNINTPEEYERVINLRGNGTAGDESSFADYELARRKTDS